MIIYNAIMKKTLIITSIATPILTLSILLVSSAISSQASKVSEAIKVANTPEIVSIATTESIETVSEAPQTTPAPEVVNESTTTESTPEAASTQGVQPKTEEELNHEERAYINSKVSAPNYQMTIYLARFYQLEQYRQNPDAFIEKSLRIIEKMPNISAGHLGKNFNSIPF